MSPAVDIIAALWLPLNHRVPLISKCRIRDEARIQFIFQFRLDQQFLHVVNKKTLDKFRVWKIVATRALRNARLQRALDRVAGQIIRTVVQPGSQQGLRFP